MPKAEELAAEFMANGRPAEATQPAGECLGGYAIMTPKVGTGFKDWAINGYSLDGCTKDEPEGVNYNPRGDWRYDREIDNEGDAYAKKSK